MVQLIYKDFSYYKKKLASTVTPISAQTKAPDNDLCIGQAILLHDCVSVVGLLPLNVLHAVIIWAVLVHRYKYPHIKYFMQSCIAYN